MKDQGNITMSRTNLEYTLIIDENFEYSSLAEFKDSLYNGTSGLWTTQTGSVLNGPHSVYIDPDIAEKLGVNTYSLEDGQLKIKVDVVDEQYHDFLKDLTRENPYQKSNYLSEELPWAQAKDANHEGGVDYFTTGQVTTKDSWASEYGYYEIKMNLPEGVGHFPAFWTVSSEGGWPPEIDIMENVGGKDTVVSTVLFNEKGVGDDVNTAVYQMDYINDKGLDFANRNDFFNQDIYERGANGEVTEYTLRDGEAYDALKDKYSVNGERVINNANSGNYEVVAKDAKNSDTYSFKTQYDVDEILYEAGITQELTNNIIFSDSIIYAAEWTPTEIIWYVGLESDNLIEVYRSETPADNTTAQYILANLQFGGSWAGTPTQSQYEQVLSETLDIDYIKIYALAPNDVLEVSQNQKYIYGTDKSTTTTYEVDDGNPNTAPQGVFERELYGDDVIVGNNLSNVINGGSGFDQMTGGRGADTFIIEGGKGNKIITDFSVAEGDKIILEGFKFESAEEAFNTLTQVGNDLWIIEGADPFSPQTVILRDINISEVKVANIEVIGSQRENTYWLEDIFKNVQEDEGGSYVQGTNYNDYLSSVFKDSSGKKITVGELRGGEEDDLYVIASSTTRVVEFKNEGLDTVRTSLADYTLGNNLENLEGMGVGLQTLQGNELDNRITGGGADTVITGYKGNDYYDLTSGGSNTIIINMKDGHDHIVGLDGNDIVRLEGIIFKDDAEFLQSFTQAGRDVHLNLGWSQSITFHDTDLVSIGLSNFEFETGINNIEYVNPNPDPIVVIIPDSILENTSNFLKMLGTKQADNIEGSSGDDKIIARQGDDFIQSFSGNDKLIGNNGNDVLSGGAGKDRLDGGAGNDILIGGEGRDVLYGHTGSDTFLFDVLQTGQEADIIRDFNMSEGDKLDISSILNMQPGDVLQDYLTFVDNKGKTNVMFDQDGSGDAYGAEKIATIMNPIDDLEHIYDYVII